MKNVKDIVKPIAVLCCICLVVTALLAYINLVTSPIIKKAEEEAAAAARKEVLASADSFTQINSKLPEGVLDAYKADNGEGFVFTVSEKGYGGEIKLICGVKPDGSIADIKTLSHGETSGIGSKVVDNGSGYDKNYFGKTASDYEQVDAVSGATISSKAYKKAIGHAFEAYKAVKGAQ